MWWREPETMQIYTGWVVGSVRCVYETVCTLVTYAAMVSCGFWGVAPQKPQETIAAYVTRVQMAVTTTSGEAIAYTGNFVKDSNTPRWKNRTAKYITAQAVFDERAVERPWTDRELAKITSCNNKYGREQQQAVRYECRCIMTTVVTSLCRIYT